MDKETLKSYFETGKKPTQAQFGALIDAFYHKNETIPQSQIEGLDTTLEAKAETTDLDTKADLNAGNLTAENVENWKEKLGVGDVPENMATIDQNDEQGNTYTKEQVDDLLENINTENISNADLIINEKRILNIATGGSLEINAQNNPFNISGLPDKTADASFDKVVKTNGERFALGEAVIFNVPETININGNLTGISNAEVSDLVKQFGDRVLEIHTSKMKKFDRWYIKTYDNIVSPNIKVENNSEIITSLAPFFDNGTDILENEGVICIHTDKILPMDKDWAVRFRVKMGHSGFVHSGQTGNITSRKIGLFSDDMDMHHPDIYVYDSGADFSMNRFELLTSGQSKIYSQRSGNNNSTTIFTGEPQAIINVMMVKVNDNIIVQTQYGNAGFSHSYSASSLAMTDHFGFSVYVHKPNRHNKSIGLVSGVEYLIF